MAQISKNPVYFVIYGTSKAQGEDSGLSSGMGIHLGLSIDIRYDPQPIQHLTRFSLSLVTQVGTQ